MTTLRCESLTLHGVRCFTEPCTATFAPESLTVVQGPNEAGKTTVLAGVGAVLFGVSARDMGDWRSDPPQAVCEGVLTVRRGEKTFVITRDFLTHATTVVEDTGAVVFEGDANPGGRRSSATRYREWLDQLLGFADVETFDQTVRLSLDGAATPLAYGTAVRELVSGAGAADFHDVEAALLRDHDALTLENPWGSRDRRNPGAIEQLRDSIAVNRDVLQQAELAAERSRTAHHNLAAIEDALRVAEEDAQAGQAAQRRLEDVLDALRARDAAEREARAAQSELREAQERAEAARQLEARLAEEYSDLDEAREETVRRLDALAESRAAEEAAWNAAGAIGAPAAPPPFSLAPWLLVVMAVAATVACLWTGRRLLAAELFLFGVVPTAVLAWVLRRRYRQMTAVHGQLHEEWERLQAKAEAATGRTSTLAMQVPSEWRECDLAQLRERLRTRAELERELALRRDSTGPARSLDGCAAQAEETALALATATARLEQLQATGATVAEITVAHAAAVRQAKQAAERAAEARARLGGAQRQVGAASEATFSPVAVLRETIADDEARLQMLTLRRDALRIAVDALREAAAGFGEQHVDALSAEASTLFETFTQPGWRVALDHASFEPLITWREHLWPLDRLSSGSRDQLAVATRLAVTRALRGRVVLPLLLDDPFVHWDADRRSRGTAMLAELARTQQVIVATSDPALADWAPVAVRLAGPASAGNSTCA